MALRLHDRRLVLRYSSSRSSHSTQPPSPSWVSEALMAVVLRDINKQPFSRGYRSCHVEKRPTRAGFLNACGRASASSRRFTMQAGIRLGFMCQASAQSVRATRRKIEASRAADERCVSVHQRPPTTAPAARSCAPARRACLEASGSNPAMPRRRWSLHGATQPPLRKSPSDGGRGRRSRQPPLSAADRAGIPCTCVIRASLRAGVAEPRGSRAPE
jgi:hypothetical protein